MVFQFCYFNLIATPWLTPPLVKEYMEEALKEAAIAADKGEVPVGAVVINSKGTITGRGFNQVERLNTSSAHAEMLALQMASTACANWRLEGHVIVVTLEPCIMCLGAILHSRISTIIFATREPKTGALGSLIDIPTYLSSSLRIIEGIEEERSKTLLKNFFKTKRSHFLE